MSDDLKLTSEEMTEFQQVLRGAFNRGELKTLVFEACAPHTWDDIVSEGSALIQQLTDLVSWVNGRQYAWRLLRTARQPNHNPSNLALKAFDEKIQARLREEAGGRGILDAPPPTIPPDLRARLVALLLKASVTQTAAGRTSLLFGLPGVETMQRTDHIHRQDLEMIVNQLAQYGRLSTGQWPLFFLIDNAKPYLAGYETEKELEAIRQSLSHLYEGG